MENYTRSEIVHVEDKMPLEIHPSTVHMKVTNGSKIRNLLGFALKKIKEEKTRQITWNAQGEAIAKAISCAEIMKRKVQKLHQITNIRFVRTEEYWEPKQEGLERLKVNKDIPAVTVLLSKDELNGNDPSYQAPDVNEVFSTRSTFKTDQGQQSHPKRTKTNLGNKKSQFTPPSLERKRKHKSDAKHSNKNKKNDQQRKPASNSESCQNKNNDKPDVT